MARPRSSTSAVHIIDAATTLFAERGPNGVSIDEIAAAVGLSRSSVFWHFGSKGGLLEAVVRHVATAGYGSIVSAGEGLRGLPAFEAAVEERIGLLTKEPKLVRLIEVLLGESLTLEPQLAPLFARYEADFVERVVVWFGEAVEDGEWPATVDIRALAVVATAALSGILGRGLRSGPAYDFAASHHAVVDVVRMAASGASAQAAGTAPAPPSARGAKNRAMPNVEGPTHGAAPRQAAARRG